MARINIPPVTRILLVVLGVQSLLSFAIRYKQWTSADTQVVIPYLTLVPQLSLFYPWTFVTTTLVENNVFTLAAGAATIYNGGRYLERAWSSKELGKFLLVVSLIPNVLAFGTLVGLFAVTSNERWTLTTISGTIPLQTSFLIAFSQLLPAHTVTLFRGLLSLRVPRFPLLYLALILLLSLTPILSTADLLLAVYSFFVSWTYLRFYKTVFPDLETGAGTNTTGAGLRGDASESFAFAEFFPNPAKKIVAGISDQAFEVLVAMKICTPFSDAHVVSASSRSGEHHTGGGYHRSTQGGGGARAEAERRRALALKALDQRLHAAAARGTPSTAAGSGGSSSAGGAGGPEQTAGVATPAPSGPVSSTQPGSSASMSRPGGGPESNMLGQTSYDPHGDLNEKSES